MWVFCPFNGPATLKVGLANFPLTRVGEHVGDWEHYTVRVSNFTGEWWSIYYSEHSGGRWIDASELEYISENKAIVYSSKDGHANYAHAGTYLLGPSKLGVGVRNDVAKSKYYVDSSTKYKIVAAEYLGDAVEEPCWLRYMREWGPTLEYNGRSEVDKVINHLPIFVRFSLENWLDLFPTELYGEEGQQDLKRRTIGTVMKDGDMQTEGVRKALFGSETIVLFSSRSCNIRHLQLNADVGVMLAAFVPDPFPRDLPRII